MNVQPSSTELPSDRGLNEFVAVRVTTESDSELAETRLARAATQIICMGEANDQQDDCRSSTREAFQYIHAVLQHNQAYLITNLIEGKSQTFMQSQMVWTIGRNRDAALPLPDPALSRRHAVILYVQKTGFQLIDLNSMNGSFVRETRIQQRVWLQDGDQIRLGNTQFQFFLSESLRTVEDVHPEILTRFNSTRSRATQFIDYSALEEPDISFNMSRT